MHTSRTEILEQLLILKKDHGLLGIKAEFEAEGSSYNDLVGLRYITALGQIRLHLKIGGAEAMRDLTDSLYLGVDGVIAPMIESPFALKKFQDSLAKTYADQAIHTSINIETKNAVDQIDQILELAKGSIHNITLGRTDLSASYMDPVIVPDCGIIMEIVSMIGRKARAAGLGFTVGGSISVESLKAFSRLPEADLGCIQAIETRKVMLSAETALHNPDSITEAIRFEELYLAFKEEVELARLEEDHKRLEKLRKRKSGVRLPSESNAKDMSDE
jgi:hypothetical protein